MLRIVGPSLALLALTAAPAAAEEGKQTLQFGALAVGKITTLSESHLYWTGAFSGALYAVDGSGPFDKASATCPGSNDIDTAAGTSELSGYCVITDGESRIIAKWQCSGKPGLCEAGTSTWSGGSGKWKGMTADVTFTGQLGAAFEDGSVPLSGQWVVSYTRP